MVPVVQSPAMTGYRSGAESRQAILAALLEREPRTVRGLADAVGISPAGMAKHVRLMARDGLLRVDRGIGRHGSSVYLTDAGRLAGKTV